MLAEAAGDGASRVPGSVERVADVVAVSDLHHEVVQALGQLEWCARQRERVVPRVAVVEADVDRHVRPLYDAIRVVWQRLRDAGIAAPIDSATVHYVIVGAASLPFVNAPEARLLTGTEPTEPNWVEAHADGLVRTLLPGLA